MPIFDIHGYLGGSVVPGVANNAASIKSAMDARGIDASVLLSSHARSVDPLAGNRILRATLEQAPGLHGCLVTHVNRTASSTAVMRELMANRRFVAMAITPVRPGDPVDKMTADEILNAYRRYSKPLFLFTPDARAVHAAVEIARAYAMLKIVLLGMGGEDWRTAIAAAHAVTSIYLETSGVLDRAKIPAAVEMIGAHRIVFGSSSPHVDAAAAVGLIEDSAVSDDVRRRILSDNARRLFGLDNAE